MTKCKIMLLLFIPLVLLVAFDRTNDTNIIGDPTIFDDMINVSIVTQPEIGSWNSGGFMTLFIWKYMSTYIPLRISPVPKSELTSILNNTNSIPDILVMTDIRDIDTSTLNVVRNYVKDGGKLIVVGVTAKNDENGTIQTVHRLGDVLGLKLRTWAIAGDRPYVSLQMPQWYLFNKEIYDNFSKRSEGIYIELPNKMKGFTVDVIASPDSKTIMRLHNIKDENNSRNIYIDGIIKHNYGKGETFFFPVGFENFHGWQSMDSISNHWKNAGIYFMFMFYYSVVLDLYRDSIIPLISTAPNGRDGTVTIELDIEGDYGKLPISKYGLSDPEAYSEQAYEDLSTIWKYKIFENSNLSWFKGKWEFAILAKILDKGNNNLTTRTAYIIRFIKQYGVIGLHSYDHLSFHTYNNNMTYISECNIRRECGKWEIDNAFRVWQLLVDKNWISYPAFYWMPMMEVPDKYDDIEPYLDAGKTTIFWWADVRTPYRLIPFPLVDKAMVRNMSEFDFYTIPQAANRIHGISKDWEPRSLELSKYGISPILIYVWNDYEHQQVLQGNVKRQLLEIKSYVDKGRLEFVDAYQFNDWWKARSKVSFTSLNIRTYNIFFNLNIPENIKGLTISLLNNEKKVSNVLIDGIRCNCTYKDKIVLPSLSVGNHMVQIDFPEK